MDQLKGEFCIVNGELSKSSEFNFSKVEEGKSIYEVLRIEDDVPVFWEDHYKRMQNSIRLANLKLKINGDKLLREVQLLVGKNKLENSNIKIVAGLADVEFLYIYFITHPYPVELDYQFGVKTVLYEAERIDPNCKIVNVEYRKETEEFKKKSAVYEALLVNRKQEITEGSRSNVFFIKGNKIITPPLEHVLPGVTRKNVIQICKKLNLDFKEELVLVSDLEYMDSVFITGTSPRVLPVKSIEDHTYDVNNNLLRNIMEAFSFLVKEYIFEAKLRF